MDEMTAIELIEKAILKVENRYISENLPWKNKEYMQTERSFAYELYHQWSTTLKEDYPQYNSNENKIIIQGEITKEMESLKTHWFPDLVVHSGQNTFNNQLMIIEIKRFLNEIPREEDIHKDLEKLMCYMSKLSSNKDRNFKLGIFISVGIKLENLKNKLIPLKDKLNNLYNHFKADPSKILCYSVFKDDATGCCSFEKMGLGDIIPVN